MEENKIIKLFTGEKVKTKDREFTKLLGGFSENNPVITVKQISDLTNYDVKVINQTITRNIIEFTKDEGYLIDLKEVTESDHNLEVLKSLGYNNMSIAKAKNIYILSEAGFLLYLKFADGENITELYKDFIEDYFKTKAENIVMEKTLEESKQTIIDERKYILGSVIFETDITKKMDLLERDRKLENQLNEIERTLAKQELMEQVQDQLVIAETFSKSNKEYSIDTLSRFFNIKGMGRNNFYKWMRDEKILMSNNQPYQKFMDDFHVIPVTNNRFADSKTLIKAKGVSYIVKKLIKDGKIQSKSYVDIIKNIDENLQQAI